MPFFTAFGTQLWYEVHSSMLDVGYYWPSCSNSPVKCQLIYQQTGTAWVNLARAAKECTVEPRSYFPPTGTWSNKCSLFSATSFGIVFYAAEAKWYRWSLFFFFSSLPSLYWIEFSKNQRTSEVPWKSPIILTYLQDLPSGISSLITMPGQIWIIFLSSIT